MQRQHLDYVQTQFEKTKVLQDRAEAIQEKSAWLVNSGARMFKVLLPIIIFLIVVVLVLLFMGG